MAASLSGAEPLAGRSRREVGAVNDRLEASDGNDALTGALAADSFSGGPGTDTITDFTPSQGNTKDGTVP